MRFRRNHRKHNFSPLSSYDEKTPELATMLTEEGFRIASGTLSRGNKMTMTERSISVSTAVNVNTQKLFDIRTREQNILTTVANPNMRKNHYHEDPLYIEKKYWYFTESKRKRLSIPIHATFFNSCLPSTISEYYLSLSTEQPWSRQISLLSREKDPSHDLSTSLMCLT